jgi:hypothetical protein
VAGIIVEELKEVSWLDFPGLTCGCLRLPASRLRFILETFASPPTYRRLALPHLNSLLIAGKAALVTLPNKNKFGAGKGLGVTTSCCMTYPKGFQVRNCQADRARLRPSTLLMQL